MRITEPLINVEGGRPRCLLPLYDASDRPVGLAQWWDDERRVVVGRIQVPLRLDVAIIATGSAPRVDIAIEVMKGVPQCRAVSVRADDDGPEVKVKDLREIDLNEWIDYAVTNVAREVIPFQSGGMLRRVTQDARTRATAKTAIRVARRPHKITKEFLKNVAEVYRDNIADKPVIAVARAFRVSENTAPKYVMQARKAGYLPPTTSGKKQS